MPYNGIVGLLKTVDAAHPKYQGAHTALELVLLSETLWIAPSSVVVSPLNTAFETPTFSGCSVLFSLFHRSTGGESYSTERDTVIVRRGSIPGHKVNFVSRVRGTEFPIYFHMKGRQLRCIVPP